MIYICSKCKREERSQKAIIIHCDDCNVIMLDQYGLDITGKRRKKISETDTIKCRISIAKAMKSRFGMQRWMLPYLSIVRKIKNITPEMINKFK